MPDVSTMLVPPHWTEPALEKLLIGKLARILKIDPGALDSTKSFDAYGLDSIHAVMTTGWLSDQLGIDLPPEFLFRYTSVDEVVQALLGRKDMNAPALTRPENRPTILFFTAAAGLDPALIRFREHPTQRLTFEVVRIGGWRDWVAQDLDFEGLLGRACRHCEQVAADGPLFLAGYSQGGQIAYGTALMLERSGRAVKFLGLLDTESRPTFERSRRSFVRTAAVGLRFAKVHYYGDAEENAVSGGDPHPTYHAALAGQSGPQPTEKAAQTHCAPGSDTMLWLGRDSR